MRKKVVVLFLLRIVKIAIGILNLSFSAKYFGVSIDRDVWILAFNSIIILDTALWGPINETFRAKFISLKEISGEHLALRKTKSLLLFTLLVSGFVVCLIMIYPSIIGMLVAPSYKDLQLASLLKMLVYVAPCFFFNQLIQIGISLLNAYESFYIPEISSFISVVINLALIVFLAPKIGIYALLVAYYLSFFILLFLVLYQIRKFRIPIFSGYTQVRWNDFSVFIVFALPFFFPYFLGQISAIIEKTIASSLGSGTVSMVDYSRKFTDMFLSVLSGVLTTILVPLLSLKFAQKKPREFVSGFLEIYQVGLLAVTFMVVMFTACPDAFVDILYNKGSIDAQELRGISILTMFYSWSGFSIFMYLVFGLALLSSGMGKKYAFWGIVAQASSIIFSIVLVKIFGINVFPLATFVSHLLAAGVMLNSFPYKKRKVLKITWKYLGILLLGMSVMWSLNSINPFVLSPLTKITFNAALLSALVLSCIFIFKLEERMILIKLGAKLFRRQDD